MRARVQDTHSDTWEWLNELFKGGDVKEPVIMPAADKSYFQTQAAVARRYIAKNKKLKDKYRFFYIEGHNHMIPASYIGESIEYHGKTIKAFPSSSIVVRSTVGDDATIDMPNIFNRIAHGLKEDFVEPNGHRWAVKDYLEGKSGDGVRVYLGKRLLGTAYYAKREGFRHDDIFID